MKATRVGETSTPRLEPLSTEKDFADVFRTSVAEGMRNVLEPDGAHAILYHLNLPNFDDPKQFHERLTSIFGVGTPSLERVILQQLHKSVEFEPASSQDLDFVGQVERARGAFELAKRGKEH